MFDRLLAEVVRTVALWILLELPINGFLVVHGICPHQVAEDAIERDLLPPINLIDLIELLQVGRDATVHGQILLANVASDGHCIKDLHEHIVYLEVKTLHYFVSECERFGHVSRLVIASQEHNVSGKILFDGEQKDAHFNSKDASVDIVAKKEVIETTGLASLANHIEQISVLAMDITNDADGLVNLNKIGLGR